MELGEAVPVVLEIERFPNSGKGRGGFDDDEVVYMVCEGVEADVEPVEFSGKEEEIVDFSFGMEGTEVVGLAEVGTVASGREGCLEGAMVP